MKVTNRSIAKCIILTLITCGIYGIYWAYCVAKEAVSVYDANDSALTEALLMIFFIPVGAFLTEKKFAEGCQKNNIPHEDKSILYLIISFFGGGFISVALIQNELNKIAGNN